MGYVRAPEVDLNSATKEQLADLPGMTWAEAGRVIAARAYNEPGELVTRGIVSKAEYDKIAGRVGARR